MQWAYKKHPVYTYALETGWRSLNFIATIGQTIVDLAMLLFVINVVRSLIVGERAGDNPWRAGTLEWSTTSPPPEYNFASIPVVASRHPLWDQRPLPTATSGGDEATKSLGPEGAEHHETPETTGLDARPQGTLDLPHPTYLPFLLACGIAVFFVGLLIKAVLVGVIGAAALVVALTWWTWRTEVDLA